MQEVCAPLRLSTLAEVDERSGRVHVYVTFTGRGRTVDKEFVGFAVGRRRRTLHKERQIGRTHAPA